MKLRVFTSVCTFALALSSVAFAQPAQQLTHEEQEHVTAITVVCAAAALEQMQAIAQQSKAVQQIPQFFLRLQDGRLVEVTAQEFARRIAMRCIAEKGMADPLLARFFVSDGPESPI